MLSLDALTGMTGALFLYDDAVKVSLGLSRGDGVSCVSFAVSCAASFIAPALVHAK